MDRQELREKIQGNLELLKNQYTYKAGMIEFGNEIEFHYYYLVYNTYFLTRNQILIDDVRENIKDKDIIGIYEAVIDNLTRLAALEAHVFRGLYLAEIDDLIGSIEGEKYKTQMDLYELVVEVVKEDTEKDQKNDQSNDNNVVSFPSS